ncbi:hypothetical protein YC2023_056693 [Brassica napus]
MGHWTVPAWNSSPSGHYQFLNYIPYLNNGSLEKNYRKRTPDIQCRVASGL